MNADQATGDNYATPLRISLFLLAAVALGLTVAYAPYVSLIVVTVPPLLLTGTRGRQYVVLLLLLFLAVQDPLQAYLEGVDPLGKMVRYADEIMIPALALFMLARSRAARQVWLDRALLVPLVVCYAALFVSTFLRGTPAYPASVDLLLFSKPFFCLTIGMGAAGSFDTTARRLLGTTPVLVALLAPAIVFFLSPDLQEAYISAVKFTDIRMGMLSATSLFSGPGTFSWFACASFCVCVAAFLVYERYKYAVIGLMSAFFCVVSWRRKSIVAMAAVIVVALAVKTRDRTRRRAAALVLIAGVLAAALIAPFLSGLWDRTIEEYGSDDPMSSARSALYYGSLLIARDHFPFGTGLATYGSHASVIFNSDAYREYGLSGKLGWGDRDLQFATDTYWPMLLGEGGVIALLALFAFFGVLVTRAWRVSVFTDATPSTRFVANLALFLLVASLFEATASHIYGASFHAALVMIPVGMFLAAARMASSTPS